MYRIALCDDETSELDKTEAMLETYSRRNPAYDIETERFEQAGALLEKIEADDYRPDLILMDIYMPDKMGIEAARELRSMGYETRIVFLTTSREHALEAYQVDAVQYLVKPVEETALFSVLDKFLKDTEKEKRKYLLFRNGGKISRIAAEDIVCCEAQRKYQCVHLVDGSELFLHTTMAAVREKLRDFPEFASVGISYIVNLHYLVSLNSDKIVMEGGRTIYLPRGSYKKLREQYFRYYCEE